MGMTIQLPFVPKAALLLKQTLAAEGDERIGVLFARAVAVPLGSL